MNGLEMALPLDGIIAEHERVEPYAQRLKDLIQRYDPEARFHLQVSNVPEYWDLDAYVHPDLWDDPDFGDALAHEATELLLDHDVAICVIRHPRRD